MVSLLYKNVWSAGHIPHWADVAPGDCGLLVDVAVLGSKRSWRSFPTKMVLWFCGWSGVPPQKEKRCLELNLFELLSQIRQELVLLNGCRASLSRLKADGRKLSFFIGLSYPAPLVLFKVNLVKWYFGECWRHSAGLGWHQGSIPLPAFHDEDPSALSHDRQGFWRDLPTMGLCKEAADLGCDWGTALAGCRHPEPWNGGLFPHTPAEADPTASSARQPICMWSSCPRSDCFGLFISCSRLCFLLPPQANCFAKLPRYTNFLWQLTSLADEFCHHPSPELISLPVLQS